MIDRIDLSPKARDCIRELLVRNRKSLEDIALFVQNMSMALDVDEATFCFDTDELAFVRMLPTVPEEDVLRLDEASEAAHQEEPTCGAKIS